MMNERFPDEARKLGLKQGYPWEELTGSEEAKRYFGNIKKYLGELGYSMNSSTKVLEIGCGKGFLFDEFKLNNVSAIGLDVRPRSFRVPQVAARIEQLPFPDESFEILISVAVFDLSVYQQDQVKMMNEITRVLKPGGFFFCYNVSGDYTEPQALVKLKDDSYLHVYRKESSKEIFDVAK